MLCSGAQSVAPVARVEFFATTPKGTERALRDELNELAFASVRASRGGVHFQGELGEGFRACLWSRIAMRVLLPVAAFECPDETALYEGVAAHDFSDVLSPKHTLVVSAACRSSRLTHTQYVAQRTKDAIVDRLRERFGARPDVDREDADVHVFVHLAQDYATVYLDLAGEPLHRRGYRDAQGEAPIKENLAAAILRLSGFQKDLPFCDPMCGSGTLLIEAGLWARGVAPGLRRRAFGFERWASFDAGSRRSMAELREAARALIATDAPPLLGSDADETVLEIARSNARRAELKMELRHVRISTLRQPSERGTLVTNAPYGERLRQASELPRELARLVDRFPDWNVGLLTAESQTLARTRRKPMLHPLYNGDLACSLRTYVPITRPGADDDSAG